MLRVHASWDEALGSSSESGSVLSLLELDEASPRFPTLFLFVRFD